jgi:hypothetical protein
MMMMMELVTMRSPGATSRNHPSLQTKVAVESGPSHPHHEPGTQTTSHQSHQAKNSCLFRLSFGLFYWGQQTPCCGVYMYMCATRLYVRKTYDSHSRVT